ncbi:MAG TPA: 5'/3'-nucleotidase SurE, partial [Desulfobacteraceae bacterium]|nr:5'/3'-nucleotidase SurE [Desulfobacteraceae bacterium]
MLILITNDDGVHSPGLSALVDAASASRAPGRFTSTASTSTAFR